MRCQDAAALAALAMVSVMNAQETSQATADPGQLQLSVSYEAGRLSVRTENTPADAVFQELARRTGVKIVVAQEVEGTEMSAALNGVELESGLRALTSKYDTFFYYGGPGEKPASLLAMWIFPKGAALTVRPSPLEARAGTKELETLLSDPEPRVRQQAYKALMTHPDSHSRQVIIEAIGGAEKEDDVRQQIFSDALSSGLEIPPEVLSGLARADNSEQIRWMALDALSQGAVARQSAEVALTDSSPAVRARAEDILTTLAAEDHRRDGSTPTPEEQQ
jgi:hypothetical protein